MLVRTFAFLAVLAAVVPTSVRADPGSSSETAETEPTATPHENRWIFSARAEIAHLRGHDEDFFTPGGSLGVIAPIPDTPLGVEGVAMLVTGEGNLVGVIDLGIRVFLPTGGTGSDSVGAFVRVGPTLDIIGWQQADATVGVGGVLGLGLNIWATDVVGFVWEMSYRITGGTELNQMAAVSLGVAISP